jgi:hypothetical protein
MAYTPREDGNSNAGTSNQAPRSEDKFGLVLMMMIGGHGLLSNQQDPYNR